MQILLHIPYCLAHGKIHIVNILWLNSSIHLHLRPLKHIPLCTHHRNVCNFNVDSNERFSFSIFFHRAHSNNFRCECALLLQKWLPMHLNKSTRSDVCSSLMGISLLSLLIQTTQGIACRNYCKCKRYKNNSTRKKNLQWLFNYILEH